MIIRPAERDLQLLMKASERIARWDRKKPSNCRVGSRAKACKKEVVFVWRHVHSWSQLFGIPKNRVVVGWGLLEDEAPWLA
jgi:hypothetical protein